MLTGGFCWPNGLKARPWQACGNFRRQDRTWETPEAALIRELDEELGINTVSSRLAPIAFASHGYDGFSPAPDAYACRRWQGVVTPRENNDVIWVRPNRLRQYPMPPADEPLIAMLQDLL